MANGLDQTSDIQLFKHFSLDLSQCTCLKDLSLLLVEKAKKSCHLTHWGLYQLEQPPNQSLKISIDQSLTIPENENLSSLKIDTEKSTETLRNLINLKDEFDHGISHYTVGQENLYFFMLPDRDYTKLLFVFRMTSSKASTLDRLECLVNFSQIQALGWKQLKIAEERLNTDDLTGVFNHRFLEPALDNELKRASRFSSEFSVMFIDLDNFKSVNDLYGHLSGSSVLVQVANIFKSLLREVDYVFRYGGDEFVIILLGADSDAAIAVAERIRVTINNTKLRMENGETSQLTVSIGIASYPRHGYDKRALIDVADKAMYQSKQTGKNKVHVYDELISHHVANPSKNI